MSLYNLKHGQYFIIANGGTEPSNGIYCKARHVQKHYVDFYVENGAWEGRMYENDIMIVMGGPSAPDFHSNCKVFTCLIPQNENYDEVFDFKRLSIFQQLPLYFKKYSFLKMKHFIKSLKKGVSTGINVFKKAYKQRYFEYNDNTPMDDDIPF